MAIQYKSLLQMTQKTSLAADDKFLVASGSRDSYVTQQCLYSTLSSDVKRIVDSSALNIVVIRDPNALNVTEPNKVAHAKITNDLKNSLANLQTQHGTDISNLGTTVSGLQTGLTNLTNRVNSFPATPVFSALFPKMDLANRAMYISDIIPPHLVPGDITIFVLFQTSSNNKYTPSFTCSVNGVAKTPERISGTASLDANDSSLKTWCHYRLKLSGIGDGSTTIIKIDNKNTNIMCSLTIYPGIIN